MAVMVVWVIVAFRSAVDPDLGTSTDRVFAASLMETLSKRSASFGCLLKTQSRSTDLAWAGSAAARVAKAANAAFLAFIGTSPVCLQSLSGLVRLAAFYYARA